MKIERNVILTGPPRSGTTLSCHLLNKLPDVVALHEPMRRNMFSSKEAAMTQIPDFFREMRRMISTEGKAISRITDGKIPDNPFEVKIKNRKSIVEKGQFDIEKQLDGENYSLVMKHNAHFSFLLKELTKKYECYAIIRNPLAVLASWNSINAPVSKGNLNVLKSLDVVLENKLWEVQNLIDRQLKLLDILFSHLHYLKLDSVIYYENIISSSGRALNPISQQAETLTTSLRNSNFEKRYETELVLRIYEKLIKVNGHWENFYNNEDYQKILNVYL